VLRLLRSRPIVLSLVGAALVILAPDLLETYAINILTRSLLYAIVALTVAVLWGQLGVLTFGQSAFFAAGAYAAGIIFAHVGFSPGLAALALLAGVAVAVGMALIVGWLAFSRRASPLYASVVTLVLTIVVTQVIFSGGNFTGSSSGLSGFDSFDMETEQWFRLAGLLLVVFTCLGQFFIGSDAGRLLTAIRENEQRCQYLGIDTDRAKMIAFAISAAVCALAGYVFACYTVVVSPELGGFAFGTELVIWVALGGRLTLLGPIIATLLVDYESAQLSGDFPFVWKLIIGSAFVVVIVLFPNGLAAIAEAAKRRALRWAKGMLASAAPAVSLRPLQISGPARAPDETAPALQIRGVRKRFGSLAVLDGIDLLAHAGQLVSLVGPNGAGKTTLMRCIADGAERSEGSILVDGTDIGRLPPNVCVKLGIGRKFQTANIFESLTVAECLRIARSRLDWPSPWRRLSTLELPPAALRVVQVTGLDAELYTEAHLLSHGKKQALELAMVLAVEPKVLLLDEPTAGLTKAERTLIGNVLVDLAQRERLCVLLVEHDLDFVRDISSRVIVLHQGRIALDGTVQDVVESELVARIYIGGAHAASAMGAVS
jgi:branched-chain amino acid transport system permease protein